MKRKILNCFGNDLFKMKQKSIVFGTSSKNETKNMFSEQALKRKGKILHCFWDERVLRRLWLPPTAARGRWARPPLQWFSTLFCRKKPLLVITRTSLHIFLLRHFFIIVQNNVQTQILADMILSSVWWRLVHAAMFHPPRRSMSGWVRQGGWSEGIFCSSR